MHSSLCSSFEISIGVWRSGLDLKKSYTFCCASLCFPLMYDDRCWVLTLSFPRPAQVSSRRSRCWWSELGMVGLRCKESRCILLVMGCCWSSSSSTVELELGDWTVEDSINWLVWSALYLYLYLYIYICMYLDRELKGYGLVWYLGMEGRWWWWWWWTIHLACKWRESFYMVTWLRKGKVHVFDPDWRINLTVWFGALFNVIEDRICIWWKVLEFGWDWLSERIRDNVVFLRF